MLCEWFAPYKQWRSIGGWVRVFTTTPTAAFEVKTHHTAQKFPNLVLLTRRAQSSNALVGIVKIHLVIDRMWYDIWIFERLFHAKLLQTWCRILSNGNYPEHLIKLEPMRSSLQMVCWQPVPGLMPIPRHYQVPLKGEERIQGWKFDWRSLVLGFKTVESYKCRLSLQSIVPNSHQNIY